MHVELRVLEWTEEQTGGMQWTCRAARNSFPRFCLVEFPNFLYQCLCSGCPSVIIASLTPFSGAASATVRVKLMDKCLPGTIYASVALLRLVLSDSCISSSLSCYRWMNLSPTSRVLLESIVFHESNFSQMVRKVVVTGSEEEDGKEVGQPCFTVSLLR